MALAEWHLTPREINDEWTEEQLALMFQKRNQRLRRLNEEMEKAMGGERDSKPRRVSPAEFMAKIRRCDQMRHKAIPHQE